MIDLETADLSRLRATITTDKGTMRVKFYADVAPGHTRNFVDLAQKGFYDGLAFHRVIQNFMVQGGCPNTREGASGQPGTGGPGYQIEAEFNDYPHKRGVLSMARSQDPNSAGSQFFVVHAEHATHLDGQYTAFGEVEADDLDVVDAIASVECSFGSGGERSTPVERIGIRSVSVEEVAEEAPPEAAPAEPLAEAPADAPADGDAPAAPEAES